jgi:hypothetical protein
VILMIIIQELSNLSILYTKCWQTRVLRREIGLQEAKM